VQSTVRLRADSAYALRLMLCPSCRAALPDDARFCPTCGNAVAAAQTEERRIVTALFADIVGFTGLAEHMDPEQVKRLVDSWFELLVADITAFGGRVDKLLGDGILALFGAPVAHEDDAERAVRTALRMHETLAGAIASSPLGADGTGADGRTTIQLRVGVNTGEALVGTLAGTDYTAMGDAVNTASRLQATAPPGGVHVGPMTYELTKHAIDYDDAGELDVRGREAAVPTWRARAATAPPGARRTHGRVELVGRSAELALAKSTIDIALLDGNGVLLDVSGESGVGKSRLVDELITHLRDNDVAVLQGACVPYGESNIWWPIASALSQYLGIEPGQSAEAIVKLASDRARRLSDTLSDTDVKRLTAAFTHLLGYPSPLDRVDALAARNAVTSAVTSVLTLRTAQKPTVLCIDDLQWADPLLLEMLADISHALVRRPFALITAQRPAGDIEWPPRSDQWATAVALRLQPLGSESARLLVDQLLPAVSNEQAAALFDRSGGNPLFLIELASLAGTGAAADALPDSLRTLIAARLDLLTIEQRQVLDNAAVLGSSGAIFALEQFAQATGQSFSAGVLHDLDDFGLLEVRGKRWSFRSDSVRDTAYQTITKSARAIRHAGVASVMASMSQAPIQDRAHHAASAAELMLEIGSITELPVTLPDDAVELLTSAAKRAREVGSLRLTARTATRALDLLDMMGATPERRLPLQLIRGATSLDQRHYDVARNDLDAALATAVATGDLAAQGDARRLLGSLLQSEGKLDAARNELNTAIELLAAAERPSQQAEALRMRGFIELFGGTLSTAESYFDQADDLYHLLDDQRGLAWVEQHRAWSAFLSGDTAVARQRLSRAADSLGELGDRAGVGWAFGLLAFVEFMDRNLPEAEQLARIVMDEAAQRGDEWAEAMMRTLLADLKLWSGNLDEALSLAEVARSKFKQLDDRFGIVQATAPIVRTQIALGRPAAAQRNIEELIALADTSVQGPFPLMAAAGAAMHRGDGTLATQLAERVVTEMDIGTHEPLLIMAMGLALLGRLDDAFAALGKVAVDPMDNPFAGSTSTLVHALAGDDEGALAFAEAVIASRGASYLDQVIAFVAAAGAHAQRGDRAQAELTLEAAVARALGASDVVALALATTTFERLIGRTHPAADGRDALGAGWLRVVNALAERSTLS
jgi:class 3 adenylate cyclase/tetratricopeptide (TPR) repeat protein